MIVTGRPGGRPFERGVGEMRIMHVVTRWQNGGTELNVAGALDHEVEAGHEVLVVVGGESDVSGLRDHPVTVVPCLQRDVEPAKDLLAVIELRRLVRRWRPHVLHTHQSKAGILGRAAGRGVGCVAHTTHMAPFGPGYGRRGMAFLMAERLIARRTDVLVSVGEDLRDLFDEHKVRARLPTLVVRSPVDLERFARHRANPGARAEARATMGLPAGAPVIVAAGALEPRKRHGLAVRAVAPVLADDPAARFLVAGSGPLTDEVAGLAGDLGVGDQVVLLGQRDDLDIVFAAADVLLHTAGVEGVPQVVVQALATGVPVVALPVGGITELARRAPEAVRPSAPEPARLEEGLRELLQRRPAAVPLSALEEWTDPAIQQQRTKLLEVFADIAACPVDVIDRPVERVSVVVPTHGRPAQLRRALDSIAAQTRPADEVVVVDDLDDPATADVVALATGPVRRLVSKSRAGVAASRNLGLAETTGDAVAFLDDDDMWSPLFLERTCQALTKADLAATWTQVSNGHSLSDGPAIQVGLRARDVVAVNPGFTGSNATYRRGALERVGGFDPELRISNDKDLLVRLLDAGIEYTVVPERLVTRDVGGHVRLGSGAEARLEGLQRYLDKHRPRMSHSQRRYLQGRMERVRRRSTPTGLARLMSTARMAVLLGPSGILQVRSDDTRSTAGR